MTPLLLTIPLLSAAPVPKDFKKDATKLSGEWALVGSDIDGVPGNIDQKMVFWTFDGDSLTIRESAPGVRSTATFHIKTDAKAVPMVIEFVGDGNRLGIYGIKAGVLVICMGMGAGIRPTNLDGGKGIVRWTFGRVDPKK